MPDQPPDTAQRCPVCGATLQPFRAKLVCPQCPYFEGCCEGEPLPAREGG